MKDIRKTMDEGSMTSFQWLAVGICILLIMLDGFDVLVMAFTASSVAAEWKLNGAQLGVLFSAGLIGMAIGSLFVAPVADRRGRQPVIVLCLVVVSAGMLMSAMARSYIELAALRAITGVGIGGMLASVGVITSEFSSQKWRSTAIALQATGYPIGATLGGLMAAWLLTHYGWRSVFVFGGLTTALMLPIVLWRLPESVDFLLGRRPVHALEKLNRLMALMGHAPLSQLPAPVAGEAVQGNTVAALFKNGLARPTLMLWAGFFLLMFSVYFSLSWTPKLLVQAGLSAQQGVTGGVLLNLGGIAGGSLFGLLAVKAKLRNLAIGSLLLNALFTALFGLASTSLGWAFAAAVGVGVFLFASMAGLYGLVPATYPAQVRATGMGWAIGIGRIGAIVAPTMAGLLLDGGWQPASLYYVFALPLVVAALAVMATGAGRSAVVRGSVAAAH
ncbi:MFS transporter [Comamonas sp. A23]|jgi:benzoate transport|uniref:MFS transporter n=1 Tax=Comamonas sp. A23 TaxID=2494248 RepID=UPI00106F3F04|nr:MFS transporter [Comamonas sp. A23]TFF54745.1 MFS transporter [Comamonas sp. A23]